MRALLEKCVTEIANIVNETVGQGLYVDDRRDLVH